MFLLLAITLALADTTTKPCALAPTPNLSPYIGISQTLAANGSKGSVLYATAKDRNDEPIEYRFTPSSLATLNIVLVHHEAVPVSKGSITTIEDVEIKNVFIIDQNGNVMGGGECEDRLAMAEGALQKMQEMYGF